MGELGILAGNWVLTQVELLGVWNELTSGGEFGEFSKSQGLCAEEEPNYNVSHFASLTAKREGDCSNSYIFHDDLAWKAHLSG